MLGFKEMQRVIYVPQHTLTDGLSDFRHPDCEHGVISSISSKGFPFVRFDKQVAKLTWEGATSQCCNPLDLTLEQPQKDEYQIGEAVYLYGVGTGVVMDLIPGDIKMTIEQEQRYKCPVIRAIATRVGVLRDDKHTFMISPIKLVVPL